MVLEEAVVQEMVHTGTRIIKVLFKLHFIIQTEPILLSVAETAALRIQAVPAPAETQIHHKVFLEEWVVLVWLRFGFLHKSSMLKNI